MNVAMLKTKLSVLVFASVALTNTQTFAQQKCMLVGAHAGAENAEYDKYIIPQLEDGVIPLISIFPLTCHPAPQRTTPPAI